MSDIELQFQPIAYQYGQMENDAEKSRYELELNWPSVRAMLPDPPASVMDYGCGSGTYVRLMLAGGYRVTGTDNAPDMIAQMDDVADHAKVWSYRDEPLNEQFDAIIAKLVVQFIEDLSAFATSMRQHLSAGGRLIISVPHPDRSRALLAKPDDRTYLTKIGDSDLTVEMIHRELEEYREVVEQSGFVLSQTEAPLDHLHPEAQPKRLNLLFEVAK